MVLRRSIYAALAFGLFGGVALRCKPSSAFSGEGSKTA